MELQTRTIDNLPIRGFPDIGQFVICDAVFIDFVPPAATLNAVALSDTGSVAGDFLALFRMLIIRFALYCLMFMRRSSIVEYINHFSTTRLPFYPG
jgi:cytochrome c biogenesis factor